METSNIMQKIGFWFSKQSLTSVQIMSDLHLEIGQQYSSFEIPISAPYLVLAGDIGRLIDYDNYLGFLKKQTSQFERVFLILGNHEFYGISYEEGLERARKLEYEVSLNGKLVLLHQKQYDIPNSNIIILGCTLWSKILNESKDVQMRVNDFEQIHQWNVNKHIEAHNQDITWLINQVRNIQAENNKITDEKSKKSILIITHYAPSILETSSPQYLNSPWGSAFATDIISKGDWTGVKFWVFGHTHYTTEFKKRGIRVVSNQRGYVFPKGMFSLQTKEKIKYDVKKVIRI